MLTAPRTETNGPGLKGVFQQIGVYFRFAQVKFKTSKYVRPIILVFLALHVAFTSFVIIEELAIYNFLGKVATTLLPKAVCAQQDVLCDVYKASAWSGAVLAVAVVVEVVITSKNLDALVEDEKMRRSHGPSSPV
ncbi:hypothetical protein BGZ58_006160 [Dissophora ornata]|nr:hypothetical protein BGZ58_006160 [Dissophora ornata]